MKRFAVAALSLLLLWTVGRLVAQDDGTPNPQPLSLDPFDPVPAEAQPLVIAEPTEDEAQRNRFLEIMRAKAELMDDAELNAAIQQAEVEIQNLQARRMLTDARETLLQLIQAHPETPAANDARRMLSLEIAPNSQPVPLEEDFEPSFTFPAETIGVPESPVIEEPSLVPLPES